MEEVFVFLEEKGEIDNERELKKLGGLYGKRKKWEIYPSSGSVPA